MLCTRHAYSKYIIDKRMFTIQFENGFRSENISLWCRVENLTCCSTGSRHQYIVIWWGWHFRIFSVLLSRLLRSWMIKVLLYKYIRGGIRPYTIFHNYNLKWDGSACQRVYTRGWQVVVQNLRKVFAII
jgi:hypothetical protein